MRASRDQTDRRVYLRRRIAVLTVLAVVLGVGVYSGLALTRELPAAAATVTEPTTVSAEPVELLWPATAHNGAVGAIGFDGVLAESGPQQTTPMASITKTVTALVVLDAKPLGAGEEGPEIPITEADEAIYYQTIAEDGSSAPVVVGSVFTQRQMLEAMMLPSANNYSVSLVNWAFGSVDAYLDAAAAWLAEHGLTGTVIADSSGLSAASASTPADLVAIGKLALAHPALREIVRQQTADLPVIGTVHNTNRLLGSNGVIGLKTGTTNVAGACLLFAAEVPVGDTEVTVVGAVLGADNHRVLAEGVTALLASVQQAFREVEVVAEGQEFGSYETLWGDTATLVAAESISVLTWQDDAVTVEASADPVAVGSDGDHAGSATISVGESQQTVPLELDGTIGQADAFWRLTNPVS